MSDTSGDVRGEWQRDLRRGPACVPIDRIGSSLTDDERAHLERCARCQAERALWESFDRDEQMSTDDEAAVQFIARRARQSLSPDEKVAVRRASGQTARWMALAAGLILAASGVLLWRNPSPGIGPPPTDPPAVYRSGSVELRDPVGDLDAPPQQFVWAPIERAASYEVRLMEVDRHVLWSSTTTAPVQPVPADIQELAVPMKTLLWDVTARDSNGTVLARSETARFRVAQARLRPSAEAQRERR